MNDYCVTQKGTKWLARYDRVIDSNGLSWMCMNADYLTTDTLNFKLIHDYFETTGLDADTVYSSQNSGLTSVLDGCSDDVIIASVDYSCIVNGNAVNNMNTVSFNGGDVIVCSLTTKNSQGTSLIFNNLGWSISILATDKSNYYFPIKSSAEITTAPPRDQKIETSFTFPKCQGTNTWDIALAVNQEPIGGDKFTLFNRENIEITNNDAADIDDQCIVFEANQLSNYIDSINSKP